MILKLRHKDCQLIMPAKDKHTDEQWSNRAT